MSTRSMSTRARHPLHLSHHEDSLVLPFKFKMLVVAKTLHPPIGFVEMSSFNRVPSLLLGRRSTAAQPTKPVGNVIRAWRRAWDSHSRNSHSHKRCVDNPTDNQMRQLD
jgi:hypothetical protein